MARRKIIKIAEKTLVVSLPTSFIVTHNLDKGDELDCIENGNLLTLSPIGTSSLKKSIELDVQEVNERVLRWLISSYHKQGYDEIIIQQYSQTQFEIISDLVKNLFVGFIIKEKSSLRIVVGSIATVDLHEFDATLRRAFRQLLVMSEETIQAFTDKNTSLLANQIEAEQTNNKLTNFCERLLNQSLISKEKGHFWYVVAWNLEKIADNYKYIAMQYATDCAVSATTISLFSQVHSYIEGYYDVFYTFSFEKLTALANQKTHLEHEIIASIATIQQNDLIALHYLHMIVLQIADFSASTIALHTKE